MSLAKETMKKKNSLFCLLFKNSRNKKFRNFKFTISFTFDIVFFSFFFFVSCVISNLKQKYFVQLWSGFIWTDPLAMFFVLQFWLFYIIIAYIHGMWIIIYFWPIVFCFLRRYFTFWTSLSVSHFYTFFWLRIRIDSRM